MSEIQFQQDGAENICGKMKYKKRFLLADEVGLGKTVTAAKIVAKKVMEKSKSGAFRVGYICGNEALAKENIRKLKNEVKNVSGGKIAVKNSAAKRLSLGFTAHFNSRKTGGKTLEIYTLTPSTTIKFTSDGTVEERAYAYALLTGGGEDELLKTVCQGRANSVEGEISAARYSLKWLSVFRDEFGKLFDGAEGWEKYKESCYKEFLDTMFAFDYGYLNDRAKQLNAKAKGNKKAEKQKYAEEKKRRLPTDVAVWLEYIRKKYQNKICRSGEVIKKFIDLVKNNGTAINLPPKFIKKVSRKDIAGWPEAIGKNNREKICRSGEIIKELIDFVKNHGTEINSSPAFVKKVRGRYSGRMTYGELTEKVFSGVCCAEMIRTARRCMAAASVDMMKMDLFLADEIQNYSEIFGTNARKNADSEMNLVIDRVIMGDHKIVLMSATPFRYHTKLSELRNSDSDPDADSEPLPIPEPMNAPDSKDNGGSAERARRYIEEETDIYREFQKIVTYLIGENSEAWFKKWEKLDRIKSRLLKKYSAKHDPELRECYRKCVGIQSQMLKDAGISRVERYMSGCASDIRSENITVGWSEILVRELRRMPRSTIAAARFEDLSDGDIIFTPDPEIADPEWYVYSEENKNLLKVNELLKGQRLDPREYYEFDKDEYDENQFLLEEVWNEAVDKEVAEYIKQLGKIPSVRKDYTKSTPAFFSFRQRYNIENLIDPYHILSCERVQNFEQLFADSQNSGEELLYNARLARLFEVLFDEEELHKLLFIPPSRRCDLNGVFEGKRGVSKRLFFTDYNMTPKSLSVLLSYEAARRTLNDMRITEDLPVVPDSTEFIEIEILKKHRSNQNCYNSKGKIVKELYEYDKEHHSESSGSPYGYALKKFDGDSDKIKLFCKAYFTYMTKLDSLRVLAAYSKGDSLYDRIISYGADGCVYDVFDEYFEYIPAEENEKVEIFSTLMKFSKTLGFPKFGVETLFKDGEKHNMPMTFAVGHYAGDKVEGSAANTLSNKIQLFNSPFRPFQFISTSIGQEGFDFHVYCRKVVHWSLESDPVKFEQREGRINRYQSYANRLNLIDGYFAGGNKEFKGFKDAFDHVRGSEKQKVDDTKGLFPDFTVPSESFKMVRECYYYPDSFESENLENVLRAVGYYRALLGQKGEESIEEELKEFIGGGNTPGYFVDLYPEN